MSPRGVDRLARIAVGLVLLVVFFELADARRAVVRAVTHHDAAPAAELWLPVRDPEFRPPEGRGLAPADRVRVVLVDGAAIDTARSMPTWSALCARGVDLVVDVGFPTVSLPVQVALWSGRSQQATGVLFHSTGKPLEQPLGARGLPGRVPGSVAVTEAAPYIVHSLGFARVEPPTAAKTLPDGWARRWLDVAAAAFASDARLAFAHILKVDVAGHRKGKRSPEWRAAAALADVELARLLAAAPDARWFVLADHDHLPAGGHGGEERDLRLVRACIAGPGVAPGHGGPVHVTDLSRALADSLGLAPDPASPGRPLEDALATALSDDDVLPRIPRARWGWAVVIVLLAAAATAWTSRGRLALLPWWFPASIGSLVVLAQVPTLSTPMIYPPKGLIMAEAFAPGLAVLAILLAATTRQRWGRALASQLLLPASLTLAGVVLIGALPLVTGQPVCPIVPRYTAWMSPVLLMMATGAGVAGLVVLASAALPPSDPSAPRGTRRRPPAAP